MGVPATETNWTVEMRNALPDDGNRYEVIDGELFVTPAAQLRHQYSMGALHLILAVEFLSASTARLDRVRKRILYQREAVDEYWIVDADAREVHRWRPADERPEVLGERLVWQPPGVGREAALTIDLPALFAEIADER